MKARLSLVCIIYSSIEHDWLGRYSDKTVQCAICIGVHKLRNHKCGVTNYIAKNAKSIYILYPNMEIADIIIKQLILDVRPRKRSSQKPEIKKPKKQIMKKNNLQQKWQTKNVRLSLNLLK